MALLQKYELKRISDHVSETVIKNAGVNNPTCLRDAIVMVCRLYLEHLKSILEEEGENGPVPTEGQTYDTARQTLEELLFVFGVEVNLTKMEDNND